MAYARATQDNKSDTCSCVPNLFSLLLTVECVGREECS